MSRIFFLTAMLIGLVGNGFCQNAQTDSLLNLLKLPSLSVKEQVDVHNSISKHISNEDSLNGRMHAEKALTLARTNHYFSGQGYAYVNLGELNVFKGNNEKALRYQDSAIAIFNSINNFKGVAQAFNSKGMCYENQGMLDSALHYYDNALRINSKLGILPELADNYNNIGMIYQYWGDYQKSIDYIRTAFAIDSKLGKQYEMAVDLSNIGLNYYYMQMFDTALVYFTRAISIAEYANRELSTAPFYNNIGLAYYGKQDFKKAIIYFKKAYEIADKVGNVLSKLSNLSNIGAVYKQLGDYSASESYYLQSLELANQTNYRKEAATSYKSLMILYKKKGEFEKALGYSIKYNALKDSIFSSETQTKYAEFEIKFESEKKQKEILLLNKENKLKESQVARQRLIITFTIAGLSLLVLLLSLLYIQMRKKRQANKELMRKNEESNQQKEEILAQADQLVLINAELEKLSLAASQTDNAIMIMDAWGNILWINNAFSKMYGCSQTEYFKGKKRTLVDSSHNPEIKSIFENCRKTRKSVVYTSFFRTKSGITKWIQTTLTPIPDESGVISKFIAIDADISIVKEHEEALNQKNEEILQQHASLEELNRKLEEQNEELSAQRDKIFIQSKEIEEKNINLLAGITYAQRIQNVILPPMGYIKSLFPESFVFYKPKDIVSGDFYWFYDTVIDGCKHALFAAVDCTGHGVPGAFMSLMSYNLLEDIVKHDKVYEPGEILNILSDRFYKAFHKSGEDINVKTGMDMVLCSVNLDTLVLKYAGASNSLYIVSEKKLVEFKGQFIPLGVKNALINEQYFTVQNQLQKGDMLYLCSDGYADQFGGLSNRKFMAKQFKQMLQNLHFHPVSEQGKIVNQTFNTWKGNFDQIDDVMVLGIRI